MDFKVNGFQRSGEPLQRIIDAALGRDRYPCSKNFEREAIWPKEALIEKTAYRGTLGRDATGLRRTKTDRSQSARSAARKS